MRYEQRDMRYKQRDKEYLIFLDGEDPQNVMRAIAIATFELAKPDELTNYRFKKEAVMTPEFADRIINLENFCVLIMGVFQGRSFRVEVFQIHGVEGDFRFCCYEENLDKLAILERAKEILVSL